MEESPAVKSTATECHISF